MSKRGSGAWHKAFSGKQESLDLQKLKMSRAGEIPCVWYSKGMSFGGGLPALDNSCKK